MNQKDKRLSIILLGLIVLYTLSSPATGLYVPGLPGNLVLKVNAVCGGNALSGVPVTLSGSWTQNTPATFNLQPDITYEVTVPLSKSIEGSTYYFVKWENGWETPIRWISFMVGKAERTFTAYYSTTDPGPRREPTKLWLGSLTVKEPDRNNYAWIEGLLSSQTEGGGINDREVKVYERVNGGDWEYLATVTTKSLCINYIEIAVDGALRYKYQPAIKHGLPRGETLNFEWKLEFEGDDEFAPCSSDVYGPVQWKNTAKWETSLTIEFAEKPTKDGDTFKIKGQLKGNSSEGWKPLADKPVFVIRHQASDQDPNVLERVIEGPITTNENGEYLLEGTIDSPEYYMKKFVWHSTFGAISVMNGPSWGEDDPQYKPIITGNIEATVVNSDKAPKSLLDVIISGWIGEDTLASMGGVGGLLGGISNFILLGIGAIIVIKVLDIWKHRRE